MTQSHNSFTWLLPPNGIHWEGDPDAIASLILDTSMREHPDFEAEYASKLIDYILSSSCPDAGLPPEVLERCSAHARIATDGSVPECVEWLTRNIDSYTLAYAAFVASCTVHWQEIWIEDMLDDILIIGSSIALVCGRERSADLLRLLLATSQRDQQYDHRPLSWQFAAGMFTIAAFPVDHEHGATTSITAFIDAAERIERERNDRRVYADSREVARYIPRIREIAEWAAKHTSR